MRKKTRGRVAFRAKYQCQAEGMHHDSCPGRSSIWVEGIRGAPWSEFDRHHVQKQAWGGTHELDNLRWIWYKCHNLIHKNETKAFELGLLAGKPDNGSLIN